MVKVYLESAAGTSMDLFPEWMALREVLDHFEINIADAVNTVDGAEIREEDMEKPLHMFGEDSVVRIVSVLKQREEPVSLSGSFLREITEGQPVKIRISVQKAGPISPQESDPVSMMGDKYREAYKTLAELRDSLDSVLAKLKEAELPF